MYTSSLAPFNTSTTPGIRAIGLGILSGALHCGLVQVNRSSSFVDPATFSTSASAGFTYSRMVFQFPDGHATPLFMLLAIRNRASGAATAPKIDVQLGTTHDGSGTLGGVTSSLIDFSFFGGAGDALGTIEYPIFSYGNASEGYFGQLLWNTSPRNQMFHVERTKDANGNISGEGVTILANIVGTAFYGTEFVDFPASRSILQPSSVTPLYPIGSDRSYASYKGEKLIGRIYPNNGQVFSVPLSGMFLPLRESVPLNSVFTLQINGNTSGTYFVNDSINSVDSVTLYHAARIF